ncbi:23S rRNA (adenine(2030)-N(6))-methyltransferase RlmJ [Shewanella colwelliana]|uniref:Ribosomal RNA large subunit methyltransferase J n=1 Tax=Shewanella colwelliana TaxID=23 RepID=A0ABQ4P6E5_SHECO|nr:23S rRNA (adenine(2030)-N(6))-methyltransferase RlmJ [Shewanella colwelliana]MCZ4339160.1 23S rRNA (adenine(2030)-N(6))-methyltransferase RlmJ [Shewanella colwelliana]GIU43107.1 ribosomal RNA large subunit methyltransferase J [Shewanella colwelliana]
MLSYRHGYHAGNYADVLKHTMLLQTLRLMHKKNKPMVYIDTHAGAGGYALSDEFAQKTGEYLEGVAKLWDKTDLPEALSQYIADVKHFNSTDELELYPGSPAFVDMNLRDNDRMVLHELHGADHLLLDEQLGGDKKIKVIKGDGLKGLIAAVPPLERRGVILVDPSYEMKTDYQEVAKAVIQAHKRFSTGVYMIWYPVVNRAQTESMFELLKQSGIRRQLRIEQAIKADSDEFGMTAAGLWVINPPWQLDELAQSTLDYLGPLLNQGGGSTQVTWEVGE